MKRILASVLVAGVIVCGCLCLTSCGDEAIPGIFYPVDSVISSLDPQIASADTERLIVLNCFEGLVRVGADGAIVNGAAESFDISPDGLTYTFKLRKNVKWHITTAVLIALKDKLPEDFSPFVTANDFVFALQRAVSPETGTKDAYLLSSVKNAKAILSGEVQPSSLGIKALDEYTLEIKLDTLDGNFLYTLAEPVAMPCNEVFFNAAAGRYGLLIKYLLCNGPFYLSILNDESWRMNLNEDYSGSKEPELSYVWLYYEASQADVISGISTGDYTAAVLDECRKKQLSDSSEALLTPVDNVTVSFVFNHQSSVFKNENIRRAFCLATDTEKIAGMFSSKSTGTFIPASCGYNEGSIPEKVNPERALTVLRAGLEEIGADSVSVDIYVDEGYYPILSEYLQTWQSTLGVNFFVTLIPVSAQELEKAVSSGVCDAAFYPLVGGYSGTRGFLMSLMPDSRANPLRLRAGAFELTMLRSALMNEEDCEILERTAADILTQDCSILPVMRQNTYYAFNAGVTGIYSPYGNGTVFFGYASFTDEKG